MLLQQAEGVAGRRVDAIYHLRTSLRRFCLAAPCTHSISHHIGVHLRAHLGHDTRRAITIARAVSQVSIAALCRVCRLRLIVGDTDDDADDDGASPAVCRQREKVAQHRARRPTTTVMQQQHQQQPLCAYKSRCHLIVSSRTHKHTSEDTQTQTPEHF